MSELPASNPPHTRAPSASDANKAIVLDFIDKAVNRGDFEAAARHVGASYTQHSPIIRDGMEGLRAHLQQLRQSFPLVRAEVKRIFAEGDFVVAQVHARRHPDDPGLAIIDIFRLEGGKLVEHWDVRQPVPEDIAHRNGMF
jgi:predicted SnoaL-like aldol condensation-catalyzing enzyme